MYTLHLPSIRNWLEPSRGSLSIHPETLQSREMRYSECTKCVQESLIRLYARMKRFERSGGLEMGCLVHKECLNGMLVEDVMMLIRRMPGPVIPVSTCWVFVDRICRT